MPILHANSPLENAFEQLFSQTFHCNWQDVLCPQFEVRFGHRRYFLDYAYINGEDRIGIEVDGRGKFFEFSHVFRDFFHRQNAIQLAGFKVYRFTWADVVHDGGWRARHQLKEIFKNKPLGTRKAVVPVAIVQTSQTNPSGNWLVLNHKSTKHHQESQDYVDAEVVNFYPDSPMGVRLMKYLLTCMGTIGLVIMLAKFIGPSEPSEMVVSSIIESSDTQAAIIKPTIYNPVVKKSVYKTIPSAKATPTTQPVHLAKIKVPPARIEPDLKSPLPILEPTPTAPVVTSPAPIQEQPTPIDEIVAFNQRTGIYHRLSCTWARRCRHCVTIRTSEAVQMGGRAAKTCDPL